MNSFLTAKTAPAAIALTALGAMAVTGLHHTGTGGAQAAVTGGDGYPTGQVTETVADDPARANAPQRPSGPAGRPNVLVFTADDMSIADLTHMPRTQRLLVDQGLNLTQGLAPTPICVPARASMVTGQYAHNHGAVTIAGTNGGFKAFNDNNTLPVWLGRAGYATAFAGKYLNGYGVNNPRYVPPGWDDWRGSVDMSTYRIYGSTYNVNRNVKRYAAHNSDVLSGFTTDIIERRDRARKPWFAWVNFVAPHTGGGTQAGDPRSVKTTVPARRHHNDFRHLNLPDHPEMGKSDGPWAGPRMSDSKRRDVREMYQQRIESLQSVDEAVGAAVAKLRRTGELANTYVILTSDNGYLYGHHNRVGKLVAYDRSLRVPMVVRGPGIAKGRSLATPTTIPDLAVTIAAIAGAKPGRRVDGVNMLPYWRSGTTYDRPVPIAGWPVTNGRSRLYSGIRYGQYTYATRGASEVLFDRADDPGELRNVANVARYAEVLRQMRTWNKRFRDCSGGSCPKAESFTAR